jgi:hypothetical protein
MQLPIDPNERDLLTIILTAFVKMGSARPRQEPESEIMQRSHEIAPELLRKVEALTPAEHRLLIREQMVRMGLIVDRA